MIKAIAVAGPTAVGKTSFSVSLAKMLGGEIISCDSMQIYRYMDIGTAKATYAERCGVPHHMIDILTPDVKYSAKDYASDALSCARDISNRGLIPIFCGGTGLYLDAVRYGRLEDDGCHDSEYTRTLAEQAQQPGGVDILYEMLMKADPESARTIHKNNVRRVIRALEIYHSSGFTKSERDIESKTKSPNIDMLVIGLRSSSRDVLYDRINIRVGKMIGDGLAKEVRSLYERGYLSPDYTAAQAIGYKEILPYIKGEASLTQCIEDLKTSSRRYAKRQMTWFSRTEGIIWLETDICGIPVPFETLYDAVKSKINNFLSIGEKT